MNRSQLIVRLNEKYPRITQKSIDGIVRFIFDTMFKAIAEGCRIEIRGFGSFSIKERAGTIRNPRMGLSIPSDPRSVVYFRAGKILKKRINDTFIASLKN